MISSSVTLIPLRRYSCLPQKDVAYELLERLVSKPAPLVERDAAAGLLRRLLLERGSGIVPGGGEYVLTIDLGHSSGGCDWTAAEEARGLE
jgi:hypothetical protein